MKNRLECMQPIRFLVVLLMCCLSYTTWAQTQSNVNGLVTDFSGEPLIGVSILVKGTSNGTVTDLEGKYVIKASIGSILSFTYIGYISSYVKIADKNVYNIQIDRRRFLWGGAYSVMVPPTGGEIKARQRLRIEVSQAWKSHTKWNA